MSMKDAFERAVFYVKVIDAKQLQHTWIHMHKHHIVLIYFDHEARSVPSFIAVMILTMEG